MSTDALPRWRRLVGWFCLVFGLSVVTLTAAGVFFVVLRLPIGLYGALGLTVLGFLGAMVTFSKLALPWLDWRKLVVVVACCAAMVGSVVWTTFFRPMGFSYVPASESESMAHWDLETGSRVAFIRHLPKDPSSRQRSPVVFLHGGPGLPELPDQEVAEALNDRGFEVVGYHQFGAGLSSRAKWPHLEYTVARQVADLEAIRARLEAESLILVGQSWGGMLAANYTAAFPDRVEGLVLTAPAPAWLPAFGVEALRALHRLSEEDQWMLHSVVAPHLSRFVFWGRVMEVNPRAADQLMGEREYSAFAQAQSRVTVKTLACDPEVAADLFFPGQGGLVNRYTFADMETVEDPRPKLSRLEVPVLIMSPECDYVAPEVVEDYARTFPRSTLVRIEGAGHEIQLERKDAYLTYLLQHLVGNSEERESEADPDIHETGGPL